ncbi:MAG: HD domain-containing protein [Thermodesulfobacteriota bacterium]|jgi:HD superfamily phosphodiesterase
MKCPGQDSRFWKPGSIFEIDCPQCGQAIEFFKDDTTRRCNKCGSRLLNPRMDFGCASYCQYAKQCLGDLPPELLAQKEDLLKDRVAVEVKKYFGKAFRLIGHTTKVARYAERIGKEEKGNLAVILPAAYLHDIGILEAMKKYQSAAVRYQEEEGPPIARDILSRLGARGELIEEVCDIVGHHHHPREEETTNYRVLYDADLIVKLEESQKEKPFQADRMEQMIEKSFLTESGRKLARKIFQK